MTTTRDLLNQARTVQAHYRSSDLDIAELVGKLADELEFRGDRHKLVQLECLDHEPVQRRDGKTPWCRVCGLDDAGNEPVSRLGRHAREEPDAATEEPIDRWIQIVAKGIEERMAAEAERDAALAALERVRRAAEGPHPESSGLDSLTLVHILAALDEEAPNV